MAKGKYIATLLHPGGLIIRFSSPFIDQVAHSQFMDTFFGHSSFIGFVHVSSRARFVHHGKLRSLPVKIRSHRKLRSLPVKIRSHGKFRSSPVKFHSSPIKFRLSLLSSSAVRRAASSSLFITAAFGRNLIEGCLELFSRLRYGTLVGEWISSFLAAHPCRVHPPFPSLPHRRTQSSNFTDNHSCAYGNNTNY